MTLIYCQSLAMLPDKIWLSLFPSMKMVKLKSRLTISFENTPFELPNKQNYLIIGLSRSEWHFITLRASGSYLIIVKDLYNHNVQGVTYWVSPFNSVSASTLFQSEILKVQTQSCVLIVSWSNKQLLTLWLILNN